MHPAIVSGDPDNCPICGMRLQLMEESAGVEVQGPGKRKILFYRHPMRPDVTSPVPAKDEMGMDYVPVYQEESGAASGAVAGRASFSVSPQRQQLVGVEMGKVDRRALEIEIRTVGKVAYDPELYNALQEYREAVKGRDRLGGSGLLEARERAEALVRAAGLRLRILGLSEDQVANLDEAIPDPESLLLPKEMAWIYAQVYEYEVDLVRPRQPVTVTAPSLPGELVEGKVATVDPILNAATRSARVRIRIPNPGGRFRPETFVHVRIRVPLGIRLSVPESAVLDTGEHQIVFVRKEGSRFEPRSVRLGRLAKGFYEVLSGLAENDEVVTSANFLIDSESRLRAALETFRGAKAPEHEH